MFCLDMASKISVRLLIKVHLYHQMPVVERCCFSAWGSCGNPLQHWCHNACGVVCCCSMSTLCWLWAALYPWRTIPHAGILDAHCLMLSCTLGISLHYHTRGHTHTHARMHAHTNTHIHAYTHAHTHTHNTESDTQMNTCMQARIHTLHFLLS